MRDLRLAMLVPHCGCQRVMAMPEKSLEEFEVN